jgi:hypothetical protein
MLTSVAVLYYDVYLLGHMDGKFLHAPAAAFGIGLMATGVFSAVRAVLFLLGLIVVGRKRGAESSTSSWPMSLVLGGLGPIISSAIQPPPDFRGLSQLFAWGWVFVFPFICARITLRRRGPNSNKSNNDAPAPADGPAR